MSEKLRFLDLGADELEPFQSRISALERDVTYPLGTDRFSIDHGPAYPAFFQRLGEVRHHLAVEGERVLGVAAAVLRTLPWWQGSSRRDAWYLCDLKLTPSERGRGLARPLLAQVLRAAGLRCPRGYAVTMDPEVGDNPVVSLARRLVPFPVSHPTTLAILGLGGEEMLQMQPIVERHRGSLSYLSLDGVKDIVLLHVQHGPHRAAGTPEPRAGALHLLCAPSNDPLVLELRSAGISPLAKASVLTRDMQGADFRQILTSDI
jgi:GNAT superfamily N-acetyltransferase